MSPTKWRALVALAVAGLGTAAVFFPQYRDVLGMLASFLGGATFVPRPGDIPYGEPK